MISHNSWNEFYGVAFLLSNADRLMICLQNSITTMRKQAAVVDPTMLRATREVHISQRQSVIDSYEELLERLLLAAEDRRAQTLRTAEANRHVSLSAASLCRLEMLAGEPCDKAVRRAHPDTQAISLLLSLPWSNVSDDASLDGCWPALIASLAAVRDRPPPSVPAPQPFSSAPLLLRLAELLEITARHSPAADTSHAACLIDLVLAPVNTAPSSPADSAPLACRLLSALRYILSAPHPVALSAPLISAQQLLLLAAIAIRSNHHHHHFGVEEDLLSCCLAVLHSEPCEELLALAVRRSLRCLRSTRTAPHHHPTTAVLLADCLRTAHRHLLVAPLSPDVREILVLGGEVCVSVGGEAFVSAAWLEALTVLLLRTDVTDDIVQLGVSSVPVVVLIINSSGRLTSAVAHRSLLLLRLLLRSPFLSHAAIEALVLDETDEVKLAQANAFLPLNDWLQAELSHSTPPFAHSLVHILRTCDDDQVVEQALLLTQQLCSASVNMRIFLLENGVPHLLRRCAEDKRNSPYLRCLYSLCDDYLSADGDW